MNPIRLCWLYPLLLAVSFWWSGAVKAQTVTGDGISRVFPTTANGNTVAFEKFMGNVQSVGRPTIAVASDGTLLASNLSKLPSGVPLTVNSTISKAASAAAVARFVGKLAYPLAVGISAYQLLNELGYLSSKAPDGSPVLQATANVSCLAFGGYGDCMPVAQAEAQCAQISGSDPHGVAYSSPGVPAYCWVGSVNARFYPSYGTVSSLVPKTLTDLQNDIAAKSGWPSSSALARATADAIASGEVVELQPFSFDGPVSSPVSEQTTSKPDGSKVKTTVTNNYTYEGNKITINNTTTTTNISPTGVVTPGDVTTKDVPADPCVANPAAAGCGVGVAKDTPFGDVPKLYEPKYPDGIATAWAARKAELMSSSIGSLSTSLMPNIASDGTCPAFVLALNFGPHMSYGSHDVAPPCWVWSFAKVVVIISALLLARRLIFGG